MRKQLLSFLVFLLATTTLWAERVDESTARTVAWQVADQHRQTTGLRSVGDLDLVYVAEVGKEAGTLRSASSSVSADYFVYNFPGNHGFVIVAGDDRVRPVLGYSTEGTFCRDNLPDNLLYMLSEYRRQIAWAEQHLEVGSREIAVEWENYLSDQPERREIKEVLLKTALWDQGDPYNALCPTIGGERTLTGCGATAMAIIMKYHEWPNQLTDGVKEHPLATEHPEWKCQPLDYTATYHWDQMPMTFDEKSSANGKQEVANLMWQVGANIEMLYNTAEKGGSSSYDIPIACAFRENLDYSPAVREILRDHYTVTEWNLIFRNEIDANRPTIVIGQSKQNGGHFFVCDGYSDSGLIHVNWGWSGANNGYYIFSALPEGGDFNADQRMFIGLEKANGQEPVTDVRMVNSPKIVDHSGLPIKTTFSVNTWFVNVGSTTIDSLFISPVIYDIQKNKIVKHFYGNYFPNFDVDDGFFDTDHPFVFRNIYIDRPLTSTERFAFCYATSSINPKFKLLSGGPTIPYIFDSKGLVREFISDFNDPLNGTTIQSGKEVKDQHFSFIWNERQDPNYNVSLKFKGDQLWNNLLQVLVGGRLMPYVNGRFYIPKRLCKETVENGRLSVSFDLSLLRGLTNTLKTFSYEMALVDQELQEMFPLGKGSFSYEDVTSIESIAASGLRVWGDEGVLHIQAEKPYANVQLLTMDGRIVRVFPLPAGETTVQVAPGVYVLRVGEQSVKIQL